MLGSLTDSEVFRNIVGFLELGYYSVLDLTARSKDLDSKLKEVNEILHSSSGLLKHYETLLRPEEYAEYTAKHRTYLLDVAEEVVHHESPGGPIRQSRAVSQACPNKKSRRARVKALYKVACRFRSDVLRVTQQTTLPNIFTFEEDGPGFDLSHVKMTSLPFPQCPALWCFSPPLRVCRLTPAVGSTLLSTFYIGSAACLIRQITFQKEDTIFTLINHPPNVSWGYASDSFKPSSVGPDSKAYHQSITFYDVNKRLTVRLPMKAYTHEMMEKLQDALYARSGPMRFEQAAGTSYRATEKSADFSLVLHIVPQGL